MHVNDRKFSVLSYYGQRRTLEEGGAEGSPVFTDSAGQDRSKFELIIEDVRLFLVGVGGRSEKEKWQHHEMLNRAILGFPEERKRILAMINDFLIKKRIHDTESPGNQYETLAEAVFAEVVGLNVLELIMKNKEGLEEIQVVGTSIFEVRGGIPRASIHVFRSVDEVEQIQQNLVLFNQDTLNVRKKWAEVRLSDGSRVTLTGFGFTAQPTLTIRFYTTSRYDLPTLCEPEYSTMDITIMRYLRCFVRSYLNMVIIGPTNSGKTHLIKALIAEMPDHERIVTIESRFELMLQRDFPKKNIVQYEIVEDDPVHDGQQAFKLALRQSPKRIVHAEIRDDDANLYMRACTRGHAGSLTSVHVHTLEDVPDAISDMCMQDGRAVNASRLVKRITEYVTQIGVEMAIIDGKRRIIRMGEYSYENDEVHVRSIALYDERAGSWSFPETLSSNVVNRIRKHDYSGYEQLTSSGVIPR
ncbi:MAG: ATPase, T2SS/T4P/T4SS family [Paenibacillaceae bacterium]